MSNRSPPCKPGSTKRMRSSRTAHERTHRAAARHFSPPCRQRRPSRRRSEMPRPDGGARGPNPSDPRGPGQNQRRLNEEEGRGRGGRKMVDSISRRHASSCRRRRGDYILFIGIRGDYSRRPGLRCGRRRRSRSPPPTRPSGPCKPRPRRSRRPGGSGNGPSFSTIDNHGPCGRAGRLSVLESPSLNGLKQPLKRKRAVLYVVLYVRCHGAGCAGIQLGWVDHKSNLPQRTTMHLISMRMMFQ